MHHQGPATEAPSMSEAVSRTQDTQQGGRETADPPTVQGTGETQALAAKEGPGASDAGASDAGASEKDFRVGCAPDWRDTLRMVELEDLHCGLYPNGRKTLDMILLANPQAGEEQSLCGSDFATDAFYAAALLQRTAVKYRMAAGASAGDARTSVAQSKGIDLGLLFGVSPADKKGYR
jgi:hypothetical protein